ncbi:hypothetical protein T484DRAFT_1893895, partial [Baffinella frigidus]
MERTMPGTKRSVGDRNIQLSQLIANQGQRRGLRLISSSQWNIREEPHGIRKTIEDSPSHAALIGNLKKTSHVQMLREKYAREIETANPNLRAILAAAPLSPLLAQDGGMEGVSSPGYDEKGCPLDGGGRSMSGGSADVASTPMQVLFSPSGFGSADYALNPRSPAADHDLRTYLRRSTGNETPCTPIQRIDASHEIPRPSSFPPFP